VSIETGQHAMQAREVAADDQLSPLVEIPFVRLTGDFLAGEDATDARLAHAAERDRSDCVVLVSSITLRSTSMISTSSDDPSVPLSRR
jgi:hypothetical protein